MCTDAAQAPSPPAIRLGALFENPSTSLRASLDDAGVQRWLGRLSPEEQVQPSQPKTTSAKWAALRGGLSARRRRVNLRRGLPVFVCGLDALTE
jgi:hypothetical protein